MQTEELGENQLLIDGLDIIEKESDRLTNMVEELLDFSRFVSGRITLDKEKINIVDIVDRISKQLKPRAEEMDITLEVFNSLDLPVIIGDKNRIKQVLINLLDNSFKFTPAGGKVTLATDKIQDSVLIEVEDNGCGISKEDLPYIMERFYKGKNSKSNSGLGLSICDEIIKLHGGSMEIKSKLNEGTRIIVSLPIEEGAEE